MKIAAVILAAGASIRLGRPKQTVVVDGETLIQRVVRVAKAAGLSPVIVVVSPEAEFAAGMLECGCMVVVNESATEGIASSIRHGIKAAQTFNPEGVVLLACDQPALTANHLLALCAQPQSVCGSRYAGKVGIPAYFPASVFDELLQIKGDTGARDLLRNALSVSAENLSFDIDTEEDIARLTDKTKFGSRQT